MAHGLIGKPGETAQQHVIQGHKPGTGTVITRHHNMKEKTA